MTRQAVLALAIASALFVSPGSAGEVSYDTALRQGDFYLSRGPAYGPDALNSLLEARRADPGRAMSDPRWLRSAAKAYALTSRYTRAFRLLQRLAAQGAMDEGSAVLRERILAETGLGRLILESALPLDLPRLSIRAAAETPLDPASRKVLNRLSELLEEGVRVGPDPVLLLVPEGRFSIDPGEGARLYSPAGPVDVEIWAGDEVRLRFVPRYPEPELWRVYPESRAVRLEWPPLNGFRYRLSRLLGSEPVRVYEGTQPAFRDSGLPVASTISYRLEVLDANGEVVAVGLVETGTLDPVRDIAVHTELLDNLRVRIEWSLGPGASDEIRVYRETDDGKTEITRSSRAQDRVLDGPFLPAAATQTLTYVVEAWLQGESNPCASSEASVDIPPRVQEVVDVSHSVENGSVIVFWSTVPREGVAEGYRIYRRAGHGVEGELVGDVRSAFAREYVYETARDTDALSVEHLVVPYVGNTMILGHDRVRASGSPPDKDFKRRVKSGRALPDLALSWNPHAETRLYAVTVADREILLKRPYVELDALQSPLFPTRYPIRVFAVTRSGERVPLVELQVSYEPYTPAKPPRRDRP